MPPENLAHETLGPVPLHRAADPPRRRDPQPWPSQGVPQHEQDEGSGRNPLASVVDDLVLAALADAILGTEAGVALHTVNFLRPLARLRFKTRRPFLVLIRARKPCVFLRRRLFG